jgi:hypothetical protein
MPEHKELEKSIMSMENLKKHADVSPDEEKQL